MNSVTIVTIKNKIPLYKGKEEANSIELIELEENGYELVANKILYQIGDKAVFIQPDHNLSDINLFDPFIRPNGNESKSMLGRVNGQARRVRAKKFNFSKTPNGDFVYSNGILLPIKEVCNTIYPNSNKDDVSYLINLDLAKSLGITKYEESESISKEGIKINNNMKFPEGLYKTDEENINNLWNYIENKIGYPLILVGTEKVDGSSITIGVTSEIPEGFICSRNTRKKLTMFRWSGEYRKLTIWEYIKFLFGFITDLKIYEEVVNNDDDFVKYGKPYLDEMIKYSYDLILRGELNGGKLKGSGNVNNPASKLTPNIKFFGVDEYYNNIAEKQSYYQFIENINYLSMEPSNIPFIAVTEVFNREFTSKEDLLTECNAYFKENMIEGIVVKTLDSKFSAKIMNLHYDSKK